MYRLCLIREFIAQHALIGGDWGAENLRHSHTYRLEWRLASASLDEHGYVADLVLLEAVLDRVIAGVNDTFLNDLPEFRGLNPSLERFARLLAESLAAALTSESGPPLASCEVRLWENDHAWAEWTLTLGGSAQ